MQRCHSCLVLAETRQMDKRACHDHMLKGLPAVPHFTFRVTARAVVRLPPSRVESDGHDILSPFADYKAISQNTVVLHRRSACCHCANGLSMTDAGVRIGTSGWLYQVGSSFPPPGVTRTPPAHTAPLHRARAPQNWHHGRAPSLLGWLAPISPHAPALYPETVPRDKSMPYLARRTNAVEVNA